MSGYRIAFFGSPAFAVPVVKALARAHDVVLVVTQPDKPSGRGLATSSPPVAEWAKSSGVPLEQPASLQRNPGFEARLAAADIEVAVTAAYGKILPERLLAVPAHGFLNVHASLLPKYRGAAPIQWALICGERETGITIMMVEAGLDTGPIRHVRRLAIHPEETAPMLFERLSQLSAETLLEALNLLAVGRLRVEPQNDIEATRAPLLTREDGRIDWSLPARAIYDRYRGVLIWPGSWWAFAGSTVKVEGMGLAAGGGAPGEVLTVAPSGVAVATGDGAILLKQVKPAGRTTIPAHAWAHGYGVTEGTVLG